MTPYKFVTREEILKVSDPDEAGKLFAKLLSERDAYREVARLSGHVCHTKDCKCGEEVDSEAARIMGEGK